MVTIKLGRAHRDNSVDALSCDSLDVHFHVAGASVQLNNLFGGDGELGKIFSIMWLSELYRELKPVCAQSRYVALYSRLISKLDRRLKPVRVRPLGSRAGLLVLVFTRS